MNYMIYVITMKWIVMQKLQIVNCKWKNQILKTKKVKLWMQNQVPETKKLTMNEKYINWNPKIKHFSF
jgi:hypothetical protein